MNFERNTKSFSQLVSSNLPLILINPFGGRDMERHLNTCHLIKFSKFKDRLDYQRDKPPARSFGSCPCLFLVLTFAPFSSRIRTDFLKPNRNKPNSKCAMILYFVFDFRLKIDFFSNSQRETFAELLFWNLKKSFENSKTRNFKWILPEKSKILKVKLLKFWSEFNLQVVPCCTARCRGLFPNRSWALTSLPLCKSNFKMFSFPSKKKKIKLKYKNAFTAVPHFKSWKFTCKAAINSWNSKIV